MPERQKPVEALVTAIDNPNALLPGAIWTTGVEVRYLGESFLRNSSCWGVTLEGVPDTFRVDIPVGITIASYYMASDLAAAVDEVTRTAISAGIVRRWENRFWLYLLRREGDPQITDKRREEARGVAEDLGWIFSDDSGEITGP